MQRLRVFAATSYGPHTALTGGRLRRDNLLAALRGRGHAIDRLDVPARPGARSALAALQLALTRAVRDRARRADVVLLGDVFCLPMMPMLRQVGTPVVVDLVDSPYRLVGAAPRGTWSERATAVAQAAQLVPVMQVLLPMAAGVTYISTEDVEVDAARVRRSPVASVVPNGIDRTLFDVPLAAPPVDGYIAWLADWTYPPNRESFSWFASEVAPQLPDEALSRLRLFGAGDPHSGRSRDGAGDRLRRLVRHAGFVDPLSAVYQGARAVVAPVVRGAGVNNKVLEPLAVGRPVITTKVGSRGLPTAISRHLRLAGTPEEMAREIMAVLGARPTENGAAAARRDVSACQWERAGAEMELALYAALRREIPVAPTSF